MSDIQQKSMTTNSRDNITQTNKKVNNGQKNSMDSMPHNRNIKNPSQEIDAQTKTRYMKTRQTIILNHTIYRHYM